MRTAALSALLLATGSACGGASTTQIREARTSRYTCSFPEVVNAVSAGVEEVFPPLGPVDASRGIVTSDYRWYEEDGTRKQQGMADVADRALSIAAIVEIRQQGDGFVVVPHAKVNQIRANMSAAQPLAEDSPDRPKWVQGKLDKLAVEVHDRLKACAVDAATPTPAPAPVEPAAPPAPAPVEPSAPPAPAPVEPSAPTSAPTP
jgi:hypothetical protein